MIRLFEIMFEIDHDITVWNNYERSFGINHEKLLAKFLQGGPGRQVLLNGCGLQRINHELVSGLIQN